MSKKQTKQVVTAVLAASVIAALTQDSITAFVHGVDTDSVKATSDRLSVFKKQVEVTDMASFKTACKEAASNAEKQGDKALVTRLSEVRQLYGATRFTDLDITGYAYHDAVKASRDKLNALGIKFDGSKKLTPDEKETAKQNRLMTKAGQEVSKGFNWSQENATEVFAQEVQDKAIELKQIHDSEASAKAMEKIQAHAKDIYAKFGGSYALALCKELELVVEANNVELVAVQAKAA